MMRAASQRGAMNPLLGGLELSDIFLVTNPGAVSAQRTLAQLQALLMAPFIMSARVVLTNAAAVFAATDVALLINKTVAGATPITLPTPALSRAILIKDMKGDAGTNNITLDAGTGKTINGLQTLVMDANYGTTMLIGMSDSQWGTLI